MTVVFKPVCAAKLGMHFLSLKKNNKTTDFDSSQSMKSN